MAEWPADPSLKEKSGAEMAPQALSLVNLPC